MKAAIVSPVMSEDTVHSDPPQTLALKNSLSLLPRCSLSYVGRACIINVPFVPEHFINAYSLYFDQL